MIFDGKEEPMRTWQYDGVVIAPDNTQGRAYEIHNASNKINLEKYQKLMQDFGELYQLEDGNYRIKFVNYIDEKDSRRILTF
jgi:hypothetical protein